MMENQYLILKYKEPNVLHLYLFIVEYLNKKKLSISNDILAIVDGLNNKIIRFFDMSTGKAMNFTVEHTLEI